MSFLKHSDNYQPNNIQSAPKESNFPVGYESSETMVQLRVAPKPCGTQLYDHDKHSEQKDICAKLEEQENQLFSSQNTIVKKISNELQYKQRQQFSSPSSVESLCNLLEKHNLVLKCNFIRPGFSASNSVLMCTPEDLRKALQQEADDFNLKKIKLNLQSDSNLSPENGTMFLSFIKSQKSGKHMLYSLDYHISSQHDKKLFSL